MWKDLQFWSCSKMPVLLDKNADVWKYKHFQQKQYWYSLNRHQRASSLLAWEANYSCSEGLNLKQFRNKAYGRICRKGECEEREEEISQIKQCLTNTAGGSREVGTVQVWCGFIIVPRPLCQWFWLMFSISAVAYVPQPLLINQSLLHGGCFLHF